MNAILWIVIGCVSFGLTLVALTILASWLADVVNGKRRR